jgi:hypothetical protein
MNVVPGKTAHHSNQIRKFGFTRLVPVVHRMLFSTVSGEVTTIPWHDVSRNA